MAATTALAGVGRGGEARGAGALAAAVLLAITLAMLASCSSAPAGVADGRGFTQEFAWQYRGQTYRLGFELHPDTYEVFRQRERRRDFDVFASDRASKPFIEEITRKVADHGAAHGLSSAEIPYFIVAFVQNLPYTSDDVTTGFDEYPRYPYETIYDNGGDCEDTSILASAMLHELGYDVALLLFPGHVAVGYQCRPAAGQPYYRHHATRYCYLETTGENWDPGVIPPNLQGIPADIRPIVERPVMTLDFAANYGPLAGADAVAVNVTVTASNLGSQTADRATLYVALRKPDTDLVWDQIRSGRFRVPPEETLTYEVADLRVAGAHPFQVYVQLRGSNFAAVEAVSEVLR